MPTLYDLISLATAGQVNSFRKHGKLVTQDLFFVKAGLVWWITECSGRYWQMCAQLTRPLSCISPQQNPLLICREASCIKAPKYIVSRCHRGTCFALVILNVLASSLAAQSFMEMEFVLNYSDYPFCPARFAVLLSR